MNPWLILGGVLAIAGAYAGGRMDGRSIAQAGELKAERAAAQERARVQGEIERAAEASGTIEVGRQQDVREIYRETETIVERPVYAARCVDADGVRLLERAAAVADGAGGSAAAGDAAGGAGADRVGGGAGRAPVPLVPAAAL